MAHKTIEDLFELIATLRGKDGCPWDREQTLAGMISSLIGETYELEWANANQSSGEIMDELGDVLFLVCYTAALFREREPSATMDRITNHVYEKIRRRHPHVFGREKAASKEESIAHWNRMKAAERKGQPEAEGAPILAETNLPPLRRAESLQSAAAENGFDWVGAAGIIDKLREETSELNRCLEDGSEEALRDEIGDLFFTVTNLARFLDVGAEEALTHANAKFIQRFNKMESLIKLDGKTMRRMTIDEMDEYWNKAKKLLSS